MLLRKEKDYTLEFMVNGLCGKLCIVWKIILEEIRIHSEGKRKEIELFIRWIRIYFIALDLPHRRKTLRLVGVL